MTAPLHHKAGRAANLAPDLDEILDFAAPRYLVLPNSNGRWIVFDHLLLCNLKHDPCSRSDADSLAAHMEEIHVRSQRQIEAEEHETV